MIHLPNLLTDLGLILVTAAITTLLFKKLKQPIVLGYIIAGFLAGPHFKLLPTVTDIESITIWAEIGVVFLLFSLGIEFSFKKLLKVGTPASITAIVEIILMLLLGFGVGKLFGWSTMDSIFLGGILSISSTTIIIRAFEELGVKSTTFATLVFGVLIVEDIVAIILLVLLSTIAVSQQFAGGEMLFATGKLIFFLILWFVLGIFFIPTFLKRVKSLMSDETLLIVSIGLCLGMVILVTSVGFSPALGAFIMGAILAETAMAERIEHVTKPVKELFGAVFFISVGMMINPEMLKEYYMPILVISLITITGKIISTTAGALFSGQPLQTSIQAGLSLAQIGEFSFIIATLGLTLKVTSEFLYPIAVAVSAITTFTTPYLIRASEPFYKFISGLLPKRMREALLRSGANTRPALATNEWHNYLKNYFVRLVLFSAILLALSLFSIKFILPATSIFSSSLILKIIALLISLIIMSPFLWGLAKRPVISKESTYLWLRSKYRGRVIALQSVRFLLAIGFIFYVFHEIFHLDYILTIGLSLITLSIISMQFNGRIYNLLEGRFLINFYEREQMEAVERGVELAPWDAHIVYYDINPESIIVGQTLQQLAVREKFGLNIARIKRGGRIITTPGKNTVIYPYDRIFVIGTDQQLQHFSDYIAQKITYNDAEENALDVSLHKIVIKEDSPLKGKSIHNSGIKEKADGIIVGLERNGKRNLNPGSNLEFNEGDIVWIVGNKKKILNMINEETQNIKPDA